MVVRVVVVVRVVANACAMAAALWLQQPKVTRKLMKYTLGQGFR
jgi:hypothetical protein